MAPKDFMDDTVAGLRSRLQELREESQRIERALAALEGAGATRRRGPGRPRGSTTGAARRGRTGTRRRSRKGGTRAEHISKLLAKNPDGMTVSDIASGLKIQPNYVYRVIAEMQKDGLARKRGRKVYAA